MKYFELLAAGIDIRPLRHAVQRQPKLWDECKLRTAHAGSPHAEVHDIWFRFQDLTPEADGSLPVTRFTDQHECNFYPAWFSLPQVRPLVYDLARRVEAVRVGRVLLTRLPPGKRIAPHVDGGEHSAYYDRYHIVLQGLPGSTFRAGDETVQMSTGECWWFQNAVEHEVVNNSQDDRIHLIVDLHI